VVSFSLTNAPLTFQILMDSIFKHFLKKLVLVSFDDMLIYKKSWEEHVQLVVMVLNILEEKQLCVNTS
jgi:hypothetical protein